MVSLTLVGVPALLDSDRAFKRRSPLLQILSQVNDSSTGNLYSNVHNLAVPFSAGRTDDNQRLEQKGHCSMPGSPTPDIKTMLVV